MSVPHEEAMEPRFCCRESRDKHMSIVRLVHTPRVLRIGATAIKTRSTFLKGWYTQMAVLQINAISRLNYAGASLKACT